MIKVIYLDFGVVYSNGIDIVNNTVPNGDCGGSALDRRRSESLLDLALEVDGCVAEVAKLEFEPS